MVAPGFPNSGKVFFSIHMSFVVVWKPNVMSVKLGRLEVTEFNLLMGSLRSRCGRHLLKTTGCKAEPGDLSTFPAVSPNCQRAPQAIRPQST
jgi:hypothetical protein